MPLFQRLLDRKNSDSSSRSLGSKHSSSASSSSSSSLFDVRSTESTELFSTPSGSSDESDCIYSKVNDYWACLKYPMKIISYGEINYNFNLFYIFSQIHHPQLYLLRHDFDIYYKPTTQEDILFKAINIILRAKPPRWVEMSTISIQCGLQQANLMSRRVTQ